MSLLQGHAELAGGILGGDSAIGSDDVVAQVREESAVAKLLAVKPQRVLASLTSVVSEAKRLFSLTSPEKGGEAAKWAEPQHQALKVLIPSLLKAVEEVEAIATSCDSPPEFETRQNLADKVSQLEADWKEVKSAASRVLGSNKRPRNANKQAAAAS